MTAARLVLWRHGQTDWNLTGRYQGQTDIDLNEEGRRQARAAAPHLAALRPDAIVSSDLSRTRETAAALAALVGLPVAENPGLREIHVGSWSGLTNDEAFALDPAFAAALAEGRDHRRSPEGETAQETGERVAQTLRELADAAPDLACVVAVTHGLATRMAVAEMLGLGFAGSQLLSSPRNCSWSVLERQRGAWRLAAYNCVAPDATALALPASEAG